MDDKVYRYIICCQNMILEYLIKNNPMWKVNKNSWNYDNKQDGE